jgi:hypothetical protein
MQTIQSDFQFIFAANPLKRLSHVRRPAKNCPNHSALYSQMKPAPIVSTRPTSERRAAAARANGAKSRGPVTALGQANSSRNSFRHGLRSRALFTDPASQADLAAQLTVFERDFAPRSSIERNLVRMMATAYWRQTCLRKLETAVLNGEVHRLKPNHVVPNLEEAPITLLARAFRSLSDHTCSLHILFRLERRFERQYDSAFNTLTEHRAWQNDEKVILNERSQQTIENTPPHPEPAPQTAPSYTTAATRS